MFYVSIQSKEYSWVNNNSLQIAKQQLSVNNNATRWKRIWGLFFRCGAQCEHQRALMKAWSRTPTAPPAIASSVRSQTLQSSAAISTVLQERPWTVGAAVRSGRPEASVIRSFCPTTHRHVNQEQVSWWVSPQASCLLISRLLGGFRSYVCQVWYSGGVKYVNKWRSDWLPVWKHDGLSGLHTETHRTDDGDDEVTWKDVADQHYCFINIIDHYYY